MKYVLQVASVNKAIAEKEREKARVEGEKSELEAAVNNHDKIMWQLNDLLSLRAKRRDAKALEAEVARCDGQLKELDYDKVEAEKNEVSRAYMKHDSRKARIGGELDQLAQGCNSLDILGTSPNLSLIVIMLGA